MNFIRFIIITTTLALSFSASAMAQTVDDDDLRSWNDLQVTVPLTKHIDLYTAATLQFRDNISRLDNSRFTAGTVFKPTKHLSITPFVMAMSVRNSLNRFRYEYRLNLRGVYRFEFDAVSLQHRSQLEYRIRPGANTWRYRPSVTVEKTLPADFVKGLKVFVTEEPFYDSAAGRFSRNRLSFGVNKSLNKKLSLDVYYLFQGDNFTRPGTEHVIGTAWKVKL